MAELAALKQPVIALGIKEPFLVKSRLLEAVIHVCCDHEIVLIFHQLKKLIICVLRRIHISVVHVREMIPGNEVAEILLEAFACIYESCSGGQPCPAPIMTTSASSKAAFNKK